MHKFYVHCLHWFAPIDLCLNVLPVGSWLAVGMRLQAVVGKLLEAGRGSHRAVLGGRGSAEGGSQLLPEEPLGLGDKLHKNKGGGVL